MTAFRRAALTKTAALFALPLLMLTATAAQPCSVVGGYKVPTNLELVAEADVIVVATVEAERRSGSVWESVVLARPTLLLKGRELPGMVELAAGVLGPDEEPPRTDDPAVLRAWYESHGDWPARRSNPRELREPNPDALSGGCVRYVFSKGMKLVLFLKRDRAGKLQPYRSPFSRDSEDVPSDEALWVKAVREYVPIADLPKGRRKAALKARVAVLSEQSGDPDALAIAHDMKVELSARRLPPYD